MNNGADESFHGRFKVHSLDASRCTVTT
jgi:hypothetical protein